MISSRHPSVERRTKKKSDTKTIAVLSSCLAIDSTADDDHLSSFKRQGFNRDEMIGLVACGHTLGGIHGVDFPEIVDVVNDTVCYFSVAMYSLLINLAVCRR